MITKTIDYEKLLKELRQAKGSVEVFSEGGCLNLFCALKVIEPSAEAWCNIDHVITKIGDKYYDITGEVECSEDYMPIESIWSNKYQGEDFKGEDMY